METQKEHSRLAKWVREVRNGTQAVNLERHFKIPCAGRRAQADTAMADPTMLYPAVTHSLRTTAEPEGWVSRQTNLPTGRNQCRSWGWGRQAFAQVRVSVENLHPPPNQCPVLEPACVPQPRLQHQQAPTQLLCLGPLSGPLLGAGTSSWCQAAQQAPKASWACGTHRR